MTRKISRRALLRRSAAAAGLLALPGGPLGERPAAAADPGGRGELPRRVLALYKSSEIYHDTSGERPKTPTFNEIHAWAQMPLNWLGLMVEYHDVDRGRPDERTMARYRGIVTWYQSEEMAAPLDYLRWLGAQLRAGRRIVILGSVGALRDRATLRTVDMAAVNDALVPTGLEFLGHWTGNQQVIELRRKNPRMVEFERRLPPGLPYYHQVVSRRPENRSHLVLARRDLPDSESHLVVTGPWGGFAAAEYVRFQFPGEAGTQWWLDPFAFFQDALGVADWPRPDTTTQCGRRIFYSHIDGDGLRNRSEVRPGACSGQVILDEILARYPLPTSASVVVAEVEPTLLGSPEFHELARAIYARPNVEAGSHSYTHPLDWEKRTRSFALPEVPYSVETETAGSIRYIEERLLPRGERVRLFQWPGSTRVSEAALAILAGLGVPNINGGDTMRDRRWPSYTRVAPLMRQVGRHWQTYTSASNENLYTNLWTGPFYGFRHVIETFENTERPRRVAPVNLYYHYYSGERVASLAALRHVYEWVMRQPLALLFTSEYLAIVEGFRTARIARGPEGWRVWDHGALRTVRFDATRAAVDMARSQGVLGFVRHQGALYVHLAGPEPALVVLADRPPPVPYLAQASHRVTSWTRRGPRVAVRLSGVGAKAIEIAGLAADREVAVEILGEARPRRLRARTDSNGHLGIQAGEAADVEVRIG
ncbi:MAG: polysaccharide deacetylase family protein [Candidatus Rokuibacteriota bacterium]